MDISSIGGLICFATGVFFGAMGMYLYKKNKFRKKLDEIWSEVKELPDHLKEEVKKRI